MGRGEFQIFSFEGVGMSDVEGTQNNSVELMHERLLLLQAINENEGVLATRLPPLKTKDGGKWERSQDGIRLNLFLFNAFIHDFDHGII